MNAKIDQVIGSINWIAMSSRVQYFCDFDANKQTVDIFAGDILLSKLTFVCIETSGKFEIESRLRVYVNYC